MITVTLQHTDNLGPEADVPALLRKLADRIRGAAGFAAEPVRVGSIVLTDYVVAGAEWASVTVTVRVPADRLAALKDGPFEALADIADLHFADLYAWRSVVLGFELEVQGREGFIERRHPRPAPAARY
jgi:5-carboxymethyl-2-hydroxymuconate isomerase